MTWAPAIPMWRPSGVSRTGSFVLGGGFAGFGTFLAPLSLSPAWASVATQAEPAIPNRTTDIRPKRRIRIIACLRNFAAELGRSAVLRALDEPPCASMDLSDLLSPFSHPITTNLPQSLRLRHQPTV